ncbi:DUF4153 domain-containing protein [Brevundimonas sp. Root1279]|uniref:DUF4153 domain-containing protein n=1 Tax=Brevundimonas sp. Root1279 TaxID=1736443 RepID=UPI0006F64BA4|nr:DUF4153 domain-containing protein [Brevundimonas sp. Root1279]KQW80724.1 hypothetical protein ASC65_12155 [Brevundimonas sp. Root1279]
MTDASEATGRNSLGRTGSPLLVVFRLAIGLAQGTALWWLYRSAEAYSRLCDSTLPGACGPGPTWPATVPELFGPLALILVMIPVLLLAGAGRMRWPVLLAWALAATAFLALLGWHSVASRGAGEGLHPPFLTFPMPIFAATALFIGHHLVLPADMERRWIAAFPTYFDTAWKAGVQLALSIGFTGALWILLHLGAALFKVIGLDFLDTLITEEWFSIPVTTLTFATAVHLTDVRDGLIRGVRSVVLMLLSWLLLLMTVLAAGFLAALPFTGLSGLWDTGSATALVLSAAGVLIILINTAYQDGRADNLPPLILRITVRVAAVLLTPFIVIAFWGLALRIGQHGLTPDRIIAFACALIGAAYAAGYGFAALQPFWRKGADWMQPLEQTNVWTAVLEIAVILALFSPIADPDRLAVADQVGRLERGAVTPDKFDFTFLRFESGKAGEAALDRLKRSSKPDIAAKAREVGALKNRWAGRDLGRPERAPVFEIAPAGAALPSGFAGTVPASDERAECLQPGQCVAKPIDVNNDGAPEVLVAEQWRMVLWARDGSGKWTSVRRWTQLNCGPQRPRTDMRDALRGGTARTTPPKWPDLEVGGARLQNHDDLPDCEESDAALPPVR